MPSSGERVRGPFCAAIACFVCAGALIFAQAPAPNSPNTAADSARPIVITLEEAIQRAEASDPAFAATKAASRSAALDRSIAAAGLLPSAALYGQELYTEPNGVRASGGQGLDAPLPIFIANNGVHEYFAQGLVNENIGLAGPAALRRANAAAAQAAAQQEIARRGLAAGVTVLFYNALAANDKVSVAEQALEEAARFTKITEEREQAREAARADVIKAQLEEQIRQREVEDARLAAEKQRLELGVLLFPDPRTAYTLSAPAPPPLASREDVDAAAAKNNPEIRSALAALRMSNADVLAARAAYLPNMQLNLTYGIDAPQLAVNGPANPQFPGTTVQNLGYSASVTLNMPVWDWLATEHKVKQSEIRRDAAQVALTAAERQLIARLDEAYAEAATARDELASLDQSVTTAAESLRLTKAAYKGGAGTVLEVVDAENAYVNVENARADGRVRYETALANLQTLTGTM